MAIGSMAEISALLDELRRAERRAAVARIVASIAHSIGTPLNVISGRAALICAQQDATEAIVSDAHCIVNKVAELASKMRGYVEALSYVELRSPLLLPEFGEVRSVLSDVVSLYQPVARLHDVGLSLGTTSDVTGTVSRGALLAVLTALVSYAIRATRSDTTIELSAEVPESRPLELPNTECVRVVVDAKGCVFLSSKPLERCDFSSLGDPTVVEGMEVALVCSSLCRAAGGKIELGAHEGVVGRAVVYFPLVDAPLET
jgi:signal transduction histidine kinase